MEKNKFTKKMVIALLDDELEWCRKQKKAKDIEIRAEQKGFIKGIKTVKFIIKQL